MHNSPGFIKFDNTSFCKGTGKSFDLHDGKILMQLVK